MFSLSPSVTVREIDLSTVVPAVATSIAATAGAFQWGPCFEKKLVTNERELLEYFGEPNDATALHWWSASNFLKYGNTLYIVRCVDDGTAKNAGLGCESTLGKMGRNAQVAYLPNSDAVEVYTNTPYVYTKVTVGTGEAADFTVGATVTQATSLAEGTIIAIDEDNDFLFIHVTTGTFDNSHVISDEETVPNTATPTAVLVMNEEILQIFAKYPGLYGNNLKVAVANQTDWASVEIKSGVLFADEFQYGPADFGTDYFAIAVLDADGQILEKHVVSTNSADKDYENNSMFVEQRLLNVSKYIVAFYNSAATEEIDSFSATNLAGGLDGTPASADIELGYDLFSNSEEFDVSIIFDGGNANDSTVQKYIITDICEVRKDCVGILSVSKDSVVGVDAATATTNCVTYKTTTLALSSSYGALYGNWKYQYDKYADKYRWIPVSGDAAGIYAYTDDQADPWFAPAGLNRGRLKNVIKLGFNPNRAQRDTLYKSQVNPVVSFPTDGPVIFGQKTLYNKPSAFDRIDVRRLFIVLEKAIATAARYFLFEKNTDFTRNQIIGMIDPFLRRVQSRQGIYDYHVECSAVNNTPAVIDNNELVCDIYIQPAKSVEFITLNFIATRTGVNFNEYIGKVSF